MNGINWKTACWMVALLSAATMGCEVGDDDGDGGVDMGAGGVGGGDGVGGMGGEGGGDAELNWVLIYDSTESDSGAGTAGADICGVSALCDGMRLTGIETSYLAGEGDICNAEGPGCMADRGDPEAALDDGEQCEAASSPSDYISLGLSGSISVDMGRDLRGCMITVREFEGSDPEAVDVFVCNAADITDETICANMDEPLGSGAGEISFAVPE